MCELSHRKLSPNTLPIPYVYPIFSRRIRLTPLARSAKKVQIKHLSAATNDGGSFKLMKNVASVALSVVFLVAAQSFAKDAVKSNTYKKDLAAVPSAELPAKAADLVKKAPKKTRAATTEDVVRAAIGINPAAAPAIVGTIAQTLPDMAPIAAAVATAEQPAQADAIAKAAGLANRSRPNRPPTQTTSAATGRRPTSSAATTPITSTAPAPLARGPAVGPPYIGLTTTPTNVTPGGSGEVPTGGRDYAAP
jgi:hypothetical protein